MTIFMEYMLYRMGCMKPVAISPWLCLHHLLDAAMMLTDSCPVCPLRPILETHHICHPRRKAVFSDDCGHFLTLFKPTQYNDTSNVQSG